VPGGNAVAVIRRSGAALNAGAPAASMGSGSAPVGTPIMSSPTLPAAPEMGNSTPPAAPVTSSPTPPSAPGMPNSTPAAPSGWTPLFPY
jgi:hypothetical protein